MRVKLIPKDAAFVHREVQSGHFHGPIEVIGVALKVFRAVYGSPELYDAYVRAGIKEALDDPRPPIPGEQVFAELRARAAATQLRTYTVELEPAEEGGYVVSCPALPGLVTRGKDALEALGMAEDAIEDRIAGLLEDGRPIPPSDEPRTEPIRTQVTVQVEPLLRDWDSPAEDDDRGSVAEAVREGADSGESAPLDMDEVIAEAEKRFKG